MRFSNLTGGTGTINGSLWSLSIVPPVLSRGTFLHACGNQYSAEYTKRALYWFLIFSVNFSPLWYFSPWTLALLCFLDFLPHLLSSGRHKALPGLCLPALQCGNTLQAILWDNCKICHICLPSFCYHWPLLCAVKYIENCNFTSLDLFLLFFPGVGVNYVPFIPFGKKWKT